MIFRDKLDEKLDLLKPEFEKIFQFGLKSQSHHSDLLLLHVNGFYNDYLDSVNQKSPQKFNPHVIGWNDERHSEAHYNFIHQYRTTSIVKFTFNEHLTNVKWDSTKSKEIDQIIKTEEISIQLEMLIYLKFWEADFLLKKLYELTRIILGEPYDWYFKIGKGDGIYNYFEKRHEIIRIHVRDRIKEIFPVLYQCINNTYRSQIRNAIAHSQYWFHGREIRFNNYLKNDQNSSLKGVSFNDWIDVFHNMLILHNQLIWLDKRINEYYGAIAQNNDDIIPIRIIPKVGDSYEMNLYYRASFKDWGWDRA
jgi:hypothetical protein